MPSSGGGGCGRGGLPRAPGAAPRVGLVPLVDVADAPVCVATVGLVRAAALPPPRVGLVLREAVRGAPPPELPPPPEGPEAPPQQPPLLLPPPPPPLLLVGLPCCCCCCFSWNGTVALMGCRRLPDPPAVVTAPPPREPAGVGDPLRLTRWDIVPPSPVTGRDVGFCCCWVAGEGFSKPEGRPPRWGDETGIRGAGGAQATASSKEMVQPPPPLLLLINNSVSAASPAPRERPLV